MLGWDLIIWTFLEYSDFSNCTSLVEILEATPTKLLKEMLSLWDMQLLEQDDSCTCPV